MGVSPCYVTCEQQCDVYANQCQPWILARGTFFARRHMQYQTWHLDENRPSILGAFFRRFDLEGTYKYWDSDRRSQSHLYPSVHSIVSTSLTHQSKYY
jgi:hypothetical protein